MSEPICAICLDRLVGLKDELLVEMPAVVMKACGHTFHRSCAIKAADALDKQRKHFGDVDEGDENCPECPACKGKKWECAEFLCDGTHEPHEGFTNLFFSADGDPMITIPDELPMNEDTKRKIDLARVALKYGLEVDELTSRLKKNDEDEAAVEDSDSDDEFQLLPGTLVQRLNRAFGIDAKNGMKKQEAKIKKLLEDLANEKIDRVLQSKVSAIRTSLTSLDAQLGLIPLLDTQQAEIQRLHKEGNDLRSQSTAAATALKATYDADIKAVEAHHAVETTILSDTQADEIKRISQKHESEMHHETTKLQQEVVALKRLKEDNEMDIQLEKMQNVLDRQELERKAKGDLKKNDTAHKKEINELKNKLLLSCTKGDLTMLQKKYEDKRDKNKNLQAEINRIKSLDVRNKGLRKENDFLKNQFQELKHKINTLRCSPEPSDNAESSSSSYASCASFLGDRFPRQIIPLNRSYLSKHTTNSFSPNTQAISSSTASSDVATAEPPSPSPKSISFPFNPLATPFKYSTTGSSPGTPLFSTSAAANGLKPIINGPAFTFKPGSYASTLELSPDPRPILWSPWNSDSTTSSPDRDLITTPTKSVVAADAGSSKQTYQPAALQPFPSRTLRWINDRK